MESRRRGVCAREIEYLGLKLAGIEVMSIEYMEGERKEEKVTGIEYMGRGRAQGPGPRGRWD